MLIVNSTGPGLSFPSRERGLKQVDNIVGDNNVRVVPLAGTWIETPVFRLMIDRHPVVPLAGTWIETPKKRSKRQKQTVVPLAGTWIETKGISGLVVNLTSFPSRERGLKHYRGCF